MKIGKSIAVFLCFVQMMAILWIACSAAAAATTTSTQRKISQEGGTLLKSRLTQNCEAPRGRTDCIGETACVEIEEILFTCCAIQDPTVKINLRPCPHLATTQSQTVIGSENNRYGTKSAVVNCDDGVSGREGCRKCKMLDTGILFECCADETILPEPI